MNRDEQRRRPPALPPRERIHGGLRSLYPSEEDGGTWIGINQAGLSMALINWYSKQQLGEPPIFGRGRIIPSLLVHHDADAAAEALFSLPLGRINPFRMIIVDRRASRIIELASDSLRPEKVDRPWTRAHWFSSGFKEDEVSSFRRNTFEKEAAVSVKDADWIRKMHRSHDPQKGPFSICMHREDACTVSFTEIAVSDVKISLRYHAGSPCADITETALPQALDADRSPPDQGGTCFTLKV